MNRDPINPKPEFGKVFCVLCLGLLESLSSVSRKIPGEAHERRHRVRQADPVQYHEDACFDVRTKYIDIVAKDPVVGRSA